MWLYYRVMSQNDADGMANSVDPDQTRSSLIWVCTVCQAYLSENLGSLRRNVPKFSDRQVWENSADPDQTGGAV